MKIYGKKFSPRYQLACFCDALAPPVLFVHWYRANYLGVNDATVNGMHRTGLLFYAAIMIIAARAVLRVEQAVRAPEVYAWDTVRALRWLVLLTVMALAIRLLKLGN